MIKYVKGDIFSSPSRILVNAVNVVGVMGKGVALEFKNRYPAMFDKYKEICSKKAFNIGDLYLWRSSEKWVLLFPTKCHWRQPSKIEYIEKGLQRFADNWDKLGADSIAFPRLGCGNGGLEWSVVRPLMEKYLGNLPMDILVYVDDYKDPVPEHISTTEMEKWLLGEYELSGYELFKSKLYRYLNGKNEVCISSGKKYTVAFNEDKLKIDDVELTDAQTYDIWSFVRDAGFLKLDNVPYKYKDVAEAFLMLMREVGYVNCAYISDDGKKFTDKPNAYQYTFD